MTSSERKITYLVIFFQYILLSKIDRYGIRGTAHDLLQSFLKGKQLVLFCKWVQI